MTSGFRSALAHLLEDPQISEIYALEESASHQIRRAYGPEAREILGVRFFYFYSCMAMVKKILPGTFLHRTLSPKDIDI